MKMKYWWYVTPIQLGGYRRYGEDPRVIQVLIETNMGNKLYSYQLIQKHKLFRINLKPGENES